MEVVYINRQKEEHYLKSVKAKNGKVRHYVIKNKWKAQFEELLSEVPIGFEFYEFPNARVVLRQKTNP